MSNEKNEIKREDMIIMLPPTDERGSRRAVVSGVTSIVLIGANGVGKTRMSSWVEQNAANLQSQENIKVRRIPAQKSLSFLNGVDSVPTDSKKAREEVLHVTPLIGQLNDANRLIEFLVSEHNERGAAVMKGLGKSKTDHSNLDDAHLEESCIETIAKVWNSVIPDKKLDINHGNVFISVDDNGTECQYNISQLSDGERDVFYLLGEVLAAYPGTLIIIDEPEQHLHKALLNRFWDEVEKLREDCMFMYITHDYDFALSRTNSELIWVHGIHNNPADKNNPIYWDYESLNDWKEKAYGTDEETDAYMALMLEICGSSKDVLFVEGEPDGIDQNLYSRVYPGYNVIPVGSCERVIQAVRGSRDLQSVHHINVNGIVDGDRRSDNEIKALRDDGIYVLKVAQVEHLFMLPKVVSLVRKHVGLRKSLEAINNDVRKKTLEHLAMPEVSNKLILLSTKEKLKRNIDAILYDEEMSKIKNPDDFYEALKNSVDSAGLDFAKIAKSEEDEIKDAIERKDFDKALTLDSNKGLMAFTGLSKAFGWTVQYYRDQVYFYLENDCDICDELRDTFKGHIGLE